MTSQKDSANIAAAAVLETLDEIPEASCPESYAYIAIEQAGYRPPADLISILIAGGLLNRIDGPRLEITDKGKAVAKLCRDSRK